jgi:hypothetical protein
MSAHIAYFGPLTKIADFLRAGVEVHPELYWPFDVLILPVAGHYSIGR